MMSVLPKSQVFVYIVLIVWSVALLLVLEIRCKADKMFSEYLRNLIFKNTHRICETTLPQ
jgi:hypothetical protein